MILGMPATPAAALLRAWSPMPRTTRRCGTRRRRRRRQRSSWLLLGNQTLSRTSSRAKCHRPLQACTHFLPCNSATHLIDMLSDLYDVHQAQRCHSIAEGIAMSHACPVMCTRHGSESWRVVLPSQTNCRLLHRGCAAAPAQLEGSH